MESVVRWSVRIYRHLLILYPHELRCRFGAEMAEVFEDLLCAGMVERGAAGGAALWCTALWEFASVGIPSRLKASAILAGTLSFAVSSVIAWVFFRAVGQVPGSLRSGGQTAGSNAFCAFGDLNWFCAACRLIISRHGFCCLSLRVMA
jgi:hypothetical protein